MPEAIINSINRLYDTFGKYRIVSTDNGLYNARTLRDVPLHDLSVKNIDPWIGRICLIWGEAEDQKYLLPRIFELVAIDKAWHNNFPMVFLGLRYAEWRTWPDEEQAAVDEYVRRLWSLTIRTWPHEYRNTIDSLLCGIGVAYDDIKWCLDEWKEPLTREMFMNLAALYMSNEATFQDQHCELNDAFWSERADSGRPVIDWMLSEETFGMLDRAGQLYQVWEQSHAEEDLEVDGRPWQTAAVLTARSTTKNGDKTDSTIQDTIAANVDKLYGTFAKYHLVSPNTDCQADILRDTPLRTLKEEDLHPWLGRLCLTWGGCEDVKYLLPRMFELVAIYDAFQNDIETLLLQLRYAKWREWPDNEQQVVDAYMRSLWASTMQKWPHRNDLYIEKLLCGMGIVYNDIGWCLDAWKEPLTREMSMNLIGLYAANGSTFRSEPCVLENTFWNNCPGCAEVLTHWMISNDVISMLSRCGEGVMKDFT